MFRLKDKDGEEIYQDDILSFTVFDFNGGERQYAFAVRWSESDGEWQLGDADGSYSLAWILRQDDEAVIIGNIHENPKLLKRDA